MTDATALRQEGPTVSIVMAAYNAEPYIAAAIESALAQTFRDFELLVADDKSTDGTIDVVTSFDDPRVRLLQCTHGGAPATRNKAIQQARGRYIAFLDADDIWLPEKLAKQLPLFDQNRNVGVVYSRRSHIDSDGNPVQVAERACFRGRVTAQLLHTNAICFSSSVVRRDVLAHVGPFDETLELATDWDLWLRCSLCCEFDFVDEPLVKYRVGHASLSRRSIERLDTASLILERFLERSGPTTLPPRLARGARADLCCNRADILMRECPLTAWRWYAKALGHAPANLYAWKSVLSCWWPTSVKRAARRFIKTRSNEL